jgi:hypothetical protein
MHQVAALLRSGCGSKLPHCLHVLHQFEVVLRNLKLLPAAAGGAACSNLKLFCNI